jgi:hypothetical protein
LGRLGLATVVAGRVVQLTSRFRLDERSLWDGDHVSERLGIGLVAWRRPGAIPTP